MPRKKGEKKSIPFVDGLKATEVQEIPLEEIAKQAEQKALTVERMRANLDRYIAGRAVPESRAFVAAYEAEGVEVIEESGQTLLLDSTILVSGQVERLTAFERGFPIHYAHSEAGWELDPMVWDGHSQVGGIWYAARVRQSFEAGINAVQRYDRLLAPGGEQFLGSHLPRTVALLPSLLSGMRKEPKSETCCRAGDIQVHHDGLS